VANSGLQKHLKFQETFMRNIIAAAATCAVLSSAAFAQAPAAPAAPAPHPNLARNLAAQCANCHGTDGRTGEAMPALAGRPAAEIVEQMKAFKEGKRPATIMHQLAKGYTDAQIQLMADWFAAQKK
jgi:cytochrome subunit of sulfide dehydrogenase